MKSKLFLILAAGLFLATAVPCLAASAGKQVTLTGLMVCGRCKLHITKECQNVLQVQKDGKTVNYFLTMNKVAKDFHPNICQNDGEKVTVTGTLMHMKNMEMLTATKIKAAK